MTQTAFVTAEESINPARGVWVLLTVMSMMIEGKAAPSEFVITTSTGYRATLRACMSDRCAGPGAATRCVKPLDSRGQHAGQSVAAWCAHVQTHCHGPHIEHARAFAGEVGATYGSARRGQRPLAGLLAHPKRVASVGVKPWAADPYAAALEGRSA